MATDTASLKPAASQTDGRFSTFFVGQLFFGVDVLRVQEVLRAQQMTCVPRAPDVIEGLINLRGQIVTALDMRRRLGLPARGEGQTAMNVVVRTDEGAVSLLVDEIGDVVEVDSTSFERPPDNLEPAIRELVRGIHKLKGKLLLVLDIGQTLNLDVSEIEVGEAVASRRF